MVDVVDLEPTLHAGEKTFLTELAKWAKYAMFLIGFQWNG